jgi:GrpB-like predicted nucleotidyltransferase (UPF0157 family)
MPEPIPVVLAPHSADWAPSALREAARLATALENNLVEVHHIGSTSIPGIRAKPILDLMPVVHRLAELDAAEARLAALGYQWWGEYGIAGRRYCTLSDPATGERSVQLHCYQSENPEIEKHLAFRDYLRAHPEIARAYEAEKLRCQALHPNNTHTYSDAKSPWIRAQLAAALVFYRSVR